MTDLLIEFLAFGWAILFALFLLIVAPYMAHHEWKTRKNLDDLDDLELDEEVMDKLRKEVNL